MIRKNIFASKDYLVEKIKRRGDYGIEQDKIRKVLKNRACEVRDIKKKEVLSREAIEDRLRKPRMIAIERLASSSGTSGRPLVFPQPLSAIQREQAYIDWIWQLAGFTRDSRTAVLRGVHVPGGVCGTNNRLLLSGIDLEPDSLRTYQSILSRFRPKFIHCYPSILEYLLRFCRSEGLSTDWGVKGVFAGSEAIEESQVSLFSDMLKAETFAWYGQSEQVALAVFRGKGCYEFFPGYSEIGFLKSDQGALEIVGKGGLNPFFSDSWYRTGDFCSGYQVSESEVFGRPVLRVWGLTGRSAAHVVDYDGRKLPFNQVVFGLHSSSWDFVERYCFIQGKAGELFFVFSIRDDSCLKGNAIEELASSLTRRVDGIANLNFRKVDPGFWRTSRKWNYFFPEKSAFERRFGVCWDDFLAISDAAFGNRDSIN